MTPPPEKRNPQASRRGREADRLVEAVIERVRAGQLRPGQRLPSEESLGGEFQVSRTVVREALQQLKARGVVRSRRGSGTYVEAGRLDQLSDSLSLYSDRIDTVADWTELLEMRALIETESARRLAADPTDAALADARAAIRAMRAARNDLAKVAAADVAFHQAVVAASGNRLFVSVHRSFLPMTRRFATATYHSRSQAAAALLEHTELLQAIESGDPDAAARRMQAHLDASARHLLALFEAGKKAVI